ncbi:putative Jas TPL-binding domain-containing protein [Helianthus annuus]|nr:putative Jas TPL-binding domain-containing protein [Helianthus annuus]KAJ0547399.1 putative Jas TPL-binding domain-containing protein [Helianthus annuus]KAJ0719591.1 putative Jas TPL-binding domain-containing protein [Helianthus annuus]KAJ0722823.1 putative Jas TPL-binding domain-containing protein [Helianthus annuus]KAJ0902081.1 putative Jas TPL-binding domain-containing protein [Helianthus annuus]
MSFHDKGFWMGKGDGDALFGNSSRVESKRDHQWFTDATETELFPSKRQAIESPNSKSISGIPTCHLSWDNVSALQSPPNQFIDRLLGSPVRMDNGPVNKKIAHDQIGNASLVGLSMSYSVEDPEINVNYGGIRKVKVNQVKEADNTVSASNETNFITIGPNYGNEDANVTLMGHSYSGFDPAHRSMGPASSKDEETSISISNSISFGGFQDESEIETLTRPTNSYYGLTFDQSTINTLQSSGNKELDASNAIAVGNTNQGVKSKGKLEPKAVKKEAPNSFPSNVRSLMATGILDGVPVKYVSISREELRGIIKGSGYMCGCQSCNHTKALNAYEFERHAGCKTKHPNNHIYFESGKTIYQIVQELRSTPESLLFDAIQTITGSPINQKAFRSWKESFQAATRELQRIYGKDELNI